MLIFMLHLNNGIIKYNPEKERLLGRYNNGIIVAHWYPEKEKILGALTICGTDVVCWKSGTFVVSCPCC